MVVKTSKKDKLLAIIVEEYVNSASPVGSNLVSKKYLPNVSSATIRNYMVELEQEGLICQPHTSAGRVPTQSGYQYYVKNILNNREKNYKDKVVKNQGDNSQIDSDDKTDVNSVKGLAKKLAKLSGEAVLVAFDSGEVYYTGMANLFGQPEFAKQSLVHSMSEVIDHLDELVVDVFDQVTDQIEILIGEDNPLGQESSVVLSRYKVGNDGWLIGILGPSRMDYQTNVNLLDQIEDLLE